MRIKSKNEEVKKIPCERIGETYTNKFADALKNLVNKRSRNTSKARYLQIQEQ